MLKKLARFKFS